MATFLKIVGKLSIYPKNHAADLGPVLVDTCYLKAQMYRHALVWYEQTFSYWFWYFFAWYVYPKSRFSWLGKFKVRIAFLHKWGQTLKKTLRGRGLAVRLSISTRGYINCSRVALCWAGCSLFQKKMTRWFQMQVDSCLDQLPTQTNLGMLCKRVFGNRTMLIIIKPLFARCSILL